MTTKITTAKSSPVQVGPGNYVIIETSAVHVLTDDDLQQLLKLMCNGHELKGAFVWGEMTVAVTQTVKPTQLQTTGINNRRPQL